MKLGDEVLIKATVTGLSLEGMNFLKVATWENGTTLWCSPRELIPMEDEDKERQTVE